MSTHSWKDFTDMPRTLVALILFSAITSAVMSAIVCGVMTYKMAGLSAAFMHTWAGGWMTAWPVAFTVILIAGPVIRKYVYRACKCPQATITQSSPMVDN